MLEAERGPGVTAGLPRPAVFADPHI